jgi:erythronate-4-phosphate dehydrogenase
VKLLVDRNMAGVEALQALGEVELFDGRALAAADLAGADALLVRSVTRVDADLLEGCSLGFVGSATSGIDHVDRAALEARGIAFAYAPGSNADSVVDYVLSALCRHPDALARLLDGDELGIVGYGHIGRRLQQRLARLGIQCRAYDPWLEGLEALAELDTVLACPVVCLHAALTREHPWPSEHMLVFEQLAQMPQQALLINAGRGELIATGELLALAEQRPDISLVLDVWEGEPAVNPVLLAKCRFGSAHIAGYSTDGKLRATAMLARALCRAMNIDIETTGAGLPPVAVTVPQELGGQPLLSWLVAQVYDLQEDDTLLRAAMPDGFDRLRKQYRLRREVGALAVSNLETLDSEARALCQALIDYEPLL